MPTQPSQPVPEPEPEEVVPVEEDPGLDLSAEAGSEGGIVISDGGIFPLQTPDITLAQIIGAVFGAIYPVITLLGFDLSPSEQDALEQLKWIALGLFGGDAAIRIGRSVGTRYS